MPINPAAPEAEEGGSRVQSQPQLKQGPKQLNETLSLNKIQNRAGNMTQWLSVPEFNSQYQKTNNKTYTTKGRWNISGVIKKLVCLDIKE